MYFKHEKENQLARSLDNRWFDSSSNSGYFTNLIKLQFRVQHLECDRHEYEFKAKL